MKISIVIPVYNTGRTIARCVESITKGASYYDYEVILVDDGSTDQSLSECKMLANSNKRIKVIHQKNSGAAAARNAGIKISNGDYITFVDSDDYVTPNYFEVITSYIKDDSIDILWFNMREIDEVGRELLISDITAVKTLANKDFLTCFYGMNIGIGSMCSKVYRKSFIDSSAILIDEKRVYGEDWDFNLRLALQVPKILTIPDVLYNYVKYDSVSTVSTRYNKADFDVYCESQQRLERIGKEYDLKYDKSVNRDLFVYNIISLLGKLLSSTLDKQSKKKEYGRILMTPIFSKFLKDSSIFNPFMSGRQVLGSILIRWNLSYFAKRILSL